MQNSSLVFLEISGIFFKYYPSWLDESANVEPVETEGQLYSN